MSILSTGLLVGSIYFNKFSKNLRFIFYFVLLSFITEWIGFYYLYLSESKKVNIWVYYLFSPIELYLISMFFYGLIKNKIVKKTIFILIPIISIVYLIKGLPSNSDLMANYNLFMISNFLFIIYSLTYSNELLDNDLDLFRNPAFWIVFGLLFFETGVFFLSGFIKYIGSHNISLARKLFSLNHFLNIIYYSLITYGFICQARLAKRS